MIYEKLMLPDERLNNISETGWPANQPAADVEEEEKDNTSKKEWEMEKWYSMDV